MRSTTGSWSIGRGLSSSPSSRQSKILEILGLLGLGVAAVALHAAARGRFELGPGHQGLTWIALVTMGRIASHLRWAGATSAVGAAGAAMIPVWGGPDPFRGLTYLAAGLTLDGGYPLVLRLGPRVVLLAVLGGLAHVTKPLIRGLTGWPFESLLGGVAVPMATHFLFGAAGAAIGQLAMRARWRARHASPGAIRTASGDDPDDAR